ncbi:MAG: 50S ribosomal protein L29 [Acidobacteria bacterium RIFCSPLOWO2_02_FULL_59_13]|nr:MAG: 50S ribosomal protein L29 [Acidobacteria bacterium RIFCSPLOWO2_02_FULL_59_13]
MKTEQFRELTQVELENQVHDLENQLWKLRFQAATGQTEGLRKLRSLRKDLARVKTILRERELKEVHGR